MSLGGTKSTSLLGNGKKVWFSNVFLPTNYGMPPHHVVGKCYLKPFLSRCLNISFFHDMGTISFKKHFS